MLHPKNTVESCERCKTIRVHKRPRLPNVRSYRHYESGQCQYARAISQQSLAPPSALIEIFVYLNKDDVFAGRRMSTCFRGFRRCNSQTRWLNFYHPILDSLLDVLHPRFYLFPIGRPNRVLQRCLEEFLHVCAE